MELRLQKFISSMATLSDVRNLDPYNPIIVQLEHPVNAMLYTIAISIPEPSYMGIPINTIWVCMDSNKPFYMKAMKLKAFDASTYDGQVDLVDNLKQAWIEIFTYDEIFSDPQFYDNGAGGGIPGPKGDKGDKGDMGDTGPRGFQGERGADAVVDYQVLAAEVAKILGNTTTTKSLSITGPDSILEGANGQYAVNLISGADVMPIIATITATTGAAYVTIGGTNLITAKTVTADQTVVLTASYVSGGETLTATKTITITNAVLSSIASTGIPATTYEGKTYQLTTTATYANGATAAVTSNLSYVVNPVSAGTVSATGLFTAALNSADVPASVTVSYVEGGVTKTTTISFTVKNLVVTSLAIGGATTVNEGATSQFTATATRNDSSTSIVTPDATWSVSPANAGTITSGGLFTAAAVAADTAVTINASYTFEGVTVNATKAITVKNVATVVYPYYGVASQNSAKTAAFITSLPNRGPTGARQMNPCTMDAGAVNSGLSMFYAYPVSYGLATFVDLSNNFEGGMDGANGDGGLTLGPITINVMVDGVSTPFYLYQSDKSGLGVINWDVR